MVTRRWGVSVAQNKDCFEGRSRRCLPSFSHFFSDTAERLRCNTEVRSDLVLRDSLKQGGVRFHEVEVPFFSGHTKCFVNSVGRGHKVGFLKQTEMTLECWNGDQQRLPGVFLKEKNVRIFQRVDVVLGGLSAQKTLQLGNPPVFHGKLNDVLFPLMVHGVQSKASAYDKRNVPADLTFLEEKLTPANLLWNEERKTPLVFIVRELDALLDVPAKGIGVLPTID